MVQADHLRHILMRTMNEEQARAKAKYTQIVARDPITRMGFYGGDAASMGVRHDLGFAAVTLTGERGEVRQPGFIPVRNQPGYDIGSVTFCARKSCASFVPNCESRSRSRFARPTALPDSA